MSITAPFNKSYIHRHTHTHIVCVHHLQQVILWKLLLYPKKKKLKMNKKRKMPNPKVLCVRFMHCYNRYHSQHTHTKKKIMWRSCIHQSIVNVKITKKKLLFFFLCFFFYVMESGVTFNLMYHFHAFHVSRISMCIYMHI